MRLQGTSYKASTGELEACASITMWVIHELYSFIVFVTTCCGYKILRYRFLGCLGLAYICLVVNTAQDAAVLATVPGSESTPKALGTLSSWLPSPSSACHEEAFVGRHGRRQRHLHESVLQFLLRFKASIQFPARSAGLRAASVLLSQHEGRACHSVPVVLELCLAGVKLGISDFLEVA